MLIRRASCIAEKCRGRSNTSINDYTLVSIRGNHGTVVRRVTFEQRESPFYFYCTFARPFSEPFSRMASAEKYIQNCPKLCFASK